MTLFADMHDYVEKVAWEDIPQAVVDLYYAMAPEAYAIVKQSEASLPPSAALFWDGRQSVQLVSPNNSSLAKVASALNDYAVVHVGEPTADHVLIKAATGHTIGDYGRSFFNGMEHVQDYAGGSSPMTNMVLGGLLGGGLGYGGGWLASQFLPEEQFDREKIRRNAMLAGAGLGVMPGLAMGAMKYAPIDGVKPQMMADQAHDPNGPMSFRQPTWGEAGHGWFTPYKSWDPTTAKQRFDVGPEALGKSGSLGHHEDESESGFGPMTPNIPVDQFNRQVWQSVYTGLGGPPAPVAAGITGLLAGTAAATGQQHVSPFQVGLAAARGGLTGAGTGFIAGKMLGVLAGLKPDAQQQLQQLGLWGGILTGAARKLFG